MKYCINCKWCEGRWWLSNYSDWVCTSPDRPWKGSGRTNHVTGVKDLYRLQTCWGNRADNDSCGPEGKFYQKRVTLWNWLKRLS